MNKKGFILILALILTLISTGLIISINFLLTSGTHTSHSEKIYTGALQSAKGIAEYVTKLIEWDDNNTVLKCTDSPNNTTPSSFICSKGKYVLLGNYSEIGDYENQVILLSDPYSTSRDLGNDVTAYYTIYSFRVISSYKLNPEKRAIIDVIYEIEY